MRLATILIVAMASGNCRAAEADVVRVDRVEARLYYSHSGTLSEPISDEMALWNVIIGAGSAKEPSKSVLVDVILSGTRGAYTGKHSVLLEAVNAKTKQRISLQRERVGILSSDGEYHVGFWLRSTGGVPLKLSASIPGTKEKKMLKIPFECGE